MQRSHTEGQDLYGISTHHFPSSTQNRHLVTQVTDQSSTQYIHHRRNQQSVTNINAAYSNHNSAQVTSNLLNHRRLLTYKNSTFTSKKYHEKQLQTKGSVSVLAVNSQNVGEKDVDNQKDKIFQKTCKKQDKLCDKLQGWEIAYINQQNFINQDSHKAHDLEQTIKKDISHKRMKTQSRPHSRNNRNKSTQFATGQFLKQIKLKYAKAVKQQRFDDEKQKIKDQFSATKQNQIILIDDDEVQNNENQNQSQLQKFSHRKNKKSNIEDEESRDNFVKYSQRKPFITLKKVTPNAHESLRNFKDINYCFSNLNDRVNHDSLAARPESKSISRSSSKMNFTSSFQMKSKIFTQKLKGDVKHITIDSSELENTKPNQASRKKTQYIGYQRLKLKNKLRQHPTYHIDVKLSQKEYHNLNSSQSQIASKQNPIKIKLKYLQSLKCPQVSNLSTIQPQTIERAKISPKHQSGTKHKHLYSFLTINTDNYNNDYDNGGNSKSHNLLTAAAGIGTDFMVQSNYNNNSARDKGRGHHGKGQKQMEDLKKLLKKEQDNSVYLLYNDQQCKERFKSIQRQQLVRNKMKSDQRGFGFENQKVHKQKNIKIKKGFSFKQVVDIF